MSLLITIDDGPSEVTGSLIQALKGKDSCIFFCNGERLIQYPQQAREIVQAGHIIGNHAFSHHDFWKMSWADCLLSIQRTEALIDSIYNELGKIRLGRYFRFPYGSQGLPDWPFIRFYGWMLPRYRHLQVFLRDAGFTGPKGVRRLRFPYSLYDNGFDWLWTVDSKDWKWDDEKKPVYIDIDVSIDNHILLIHDHVVGLNWRANWIKDLNGTSKNS